MRILGLVSDTHDSGVALIEDGVPIVVIEEERLNRIKHTKRFPRFALEEALTKRGVSLGQIDVMTTPWNVARLRSTVFKALLKRFPASLALTNKRSHPAQRNEIVLLNFRMKRDLRRMFPNETLPRLINVGHHDSHAAAFFVSPFDEAAVLVMDGYGDDASSSAYVGRGNQLERLWHVGIFNSLGMVYTLVTQFLGFAGFADEGKVMALAAYGDQDLVSAFRDLMRPTDDGRYTVDMSYFDFDAYGMLKPFTPKFIERFGPARIPGSPITDRDRSLARALQVVTEDIVLSVTRALRVSTGQRNIVMTGGVALNCVANARVLGEAGFERVWVPPIASDSGAPLGSALWHQHQTLKLPRTFVLEHAAYGLGYSDAEVAAALDAAGLAHEHLDEASLIDRTAHDLADGRVVGWFQGRFEMGPRALGNRSILADPRSAAMRDTINTKIKKREYFRPFAPAVPLDRIGEFFDYTGSDPFMTMAPHVRPGRAHLIAAGVHIDNTGRIQTVERRHNPRYYDLITRFGELTGVPVLLNTSFNEQEPIVARPEEAIACYLRTGLDVLVLGRHYTTDKRGAARAAAVPASAAATPLSAAAPVGAR